MQQRQREQVLTHEHSSHKANSTGKHRQTVVQQADNAAVAAITSSHGNVNSCFVGGKNVNFLSLQGSQGVMREVHCHVQVTLAREEQQQPFHEQRVGMSIVCCATAVALYKPCGVVLPCGRGGRKKERK